MLEAAIERQTSGIRSFDPLVPMIGVNSNKETAPKAAEGDGEDHEDYGSADANVTGSSGGSDVTEVMAELDDSTGADPISGR